MNMKKKHKIALLVIGIFLVLSLMLSSSYALWVFNVSQESTNVLVSDCFEITFTDGSDAVNLTSSFPMRDSDGVQTTPYTFTIRNICNHAADFQINLETLNNSTLDASNIKADLNGHIVAYNNAESITPKLADASSAIMLYEDTLLPLSFKTYNLRMWLKEDAVQSEVENKTYNSKITVASTLNKSPKISVLRDGKSVNSTLKRLAGDGDVNLLKIENTSITSIQRSFSMPDESDEYSKISVSDSQYNTYAWFKDGIIFFYTDGDVIRLNSNSSYLFSKLNNLKNINVSDFDTTDVTDMSFMFVNSGLEEIDITTFNTLNVTTMRSMFAGMKNLKSVNLSNLNNLNLINMYGMFEADTNLEFVDFTNFTTSKVTNMGYMFYGNNKLSSFDLSSFDTSNVTNYAFMFASVGLIDELDISNFNVKYSAYIYAMFSSMSNLKTIYVGSGWKFGQYDDDVSVFLGSSNLVGGAGTAYNISHADSTYARVDGGASNPGYLTLKTN